MSRLQDTENKTIGYSRLLSEHEAETTVGLLTGRLPVMRNTPLDPDFLPLIHKRLLPSLPLCNWHRFSGNEPHHPPLDEIEVYGHFAEGCSGMPLIERTLNVEGSIFSAMGLSIVSGKRKISLNVYPAGKRPAASFLGSTGFRTRSEFIETILGWLGLEGAVRCFGAKKLEEFQILTRASSGVSIRQIGSSEENAGSIQIESIKLDFADYNVLWNCLERVRSSKGMAEFGCVDCVWDFPRQNWEQGHAQLTSFPFRCVEVSVVQHGFYLEPRDLQEEIRKYDLIPLGFLRNPDGAGSRPPFGNAIIGVDLIRHKDGWVVGFTSVEHDLIRQRREKLKETINTMMGSKFIVHGPSLLMDVSAVGGI